MNQFIDDTTRAVTQSEDGTVTIEEGGQAVEQVAPIDLIITALTESRDHYVQCNCGERCDKTCTRAKVDLALTAAIIMKQKPVLEILAAALHLAGGELPKFDAMYPSESGEVEIHLDYDQVSRIKTATGQYIGLRGPETALFLTLVNERLNMTMVSPKRDDDALCQTAVGRAKFQTGDSGPVYRVTLKTG